MAAAIQPEKMTSALGFGNPGAIFLPRHIYPNRFKE
jgi:hypothetical protein